jgi:hypothetical protein
MRDGWRIDLGVALTLLDAPIARLIGVTQENFKKSSSKLITAVDNAIIAS